MQVEMLDGPLKGRIVDMPFHVAQPLILNKSARDLRDEVEPRADIETTALNPLSEKAVKNQGERRR